MRVDLPIKNTFKICDVVLSKGYTQVMDNTKLAIFDLDGVLIDSKKIHYEALNLALCSIDKNFIIQEVEHATKYDGLSTTKKLEILNKEKGLPREKFQEVWSYKQKITLELLGEIKKDKQLEFYMKELITNEIKIAVASNSVRDTIDLVLKKLGIYDYISLILSNEDVKHPKPHPEIYWKTMAYFGAIPENTIIFEDSYVGRLAAQRSGASLIPIDSREDLTIEKIKRNKLIEAQNISEIRPWKSDNLTVLIPMAGAGSRFESAGYTFPKPLIEIFGKPMIQMVVENLNIDAKFVYIVQKSHFVKFNLESMLNIITPNCEIVKVEDITEGAACTTLLAKEYINNENSLIIANSDQFIEWNSGETIYSFMSKGVDGGILTFESTHPKWSYVKIDGEGYVSEVAEKKPISNLATVGIYFWRKGSDYVQYAEQMIRENERVNGEFYICPVFNYAIRDNKKIRIRNVDQMWGLGTPEDLDNFVADYKKL